MNFNSSKFGFDISTWQDDPNIAGSVNFTRMRDLGASFVILRASIGDQFDVDFPTYKANSRGVLPRGVYHYYWNHISPIVQAQKCLAAIGGEPFEGRVWLDLETTSAGAYVGPANWKIFIETIQAAGLRVGIYTGFYWWKTNAVDKGANLAYFGQFPLWQAWYTADPAVVQVALGWDYITNWQDTSSYPGAPAGVESITIDHNQWNDFVDFAAEWGTVSPPPPGGTMETWKCIYETGLRVRSGPGTSYGQAQSLAFGDKVEGVLDSISGWINIRTIIRVNGNTFAPTLPAQWWCSGLPQYMEKVIVTPPPPPPPALVVAKIEILPAAGTVIRELDAAGNVLSSKTV